MAGFVNCSIRQPDQQKNHYHFQSHRQNANRRAYGPCPEASDDDLGVHGLTAAAAGSIVQVTAFLWVPSSKASGSAVELSVMLFGSMLIVRSVSVATNCTVKRVGYRTAPVPSATWSA